MLTDQNKDIQYIKQISNIKNIFLSGKITSKTNYYICYLVSVRTI